MTKEVPLGAAMKKGTSLVPFLLGGSLCGRSRSLYDSPGFDTLRTDFDALGGSVHQHPGALQIRLPAPLGFVIRLTHVVAGPGAFATNITRACHQLSYPSFRAVFYEPAS